jgi:hypothetical protein
MSMSPEGFEDRPVPVRPLDPDQARLLEILRRTGGKPVPFSELRSLGIDNPAVLCYELEIAGVPITHVERLRRGAAPVPIGVQLDEEWFATPLAPEPPPWRARLGAWRKSLAASAASAASVATEHAANAKSAASERPREGAVRERAGTGVSLARHAWARALSAGARGLERGSAAFAVLLAATRREMARARAHLEELDIDWGVLSARRARTGMLVGAAALALVIVLAVALSSSSAPRRSSVGLAGAQNRAHLAGLRGSASSAHRSPEHEASASEGAAGSAPQSKAGGEEGGRATQLQAEGHQLLAEGHYAAAATDLRAAITASGGSPARCQEPSTESCLAYAYALYDLGRALQAQNKPGQAVPVLHERLRIDNQRQTVLAQLHSARQQMHAVTPHPRWRPSHAKGHWRNHHSVASPRPNATPPTTGPETSGEQPHPPSTTGGPSSEGGAGEAPEISGSPTHGGAQGPPSTND